MGLLKKEREVLQKMGLSIQDGHLIKSLSGRPLEIWKSRDSRLHGIKTWINCSETRVITEELWSYFQNKGNYLFLGGDYSGHAEIVNVNGQNDRTGLGIQELIVLPDCADPFNIIEAIGTSWPNPHIETNRLLNLLRLIDQVAPIKINTIAEDIIVFWIHVPEETAQQIATMIFNLGLPEVDSDFDIEEKKASILSGECTLWWD